MADYNEVAQQFVRFYYDTFDAGRENLAALYRDSSMLTFENSAIQGTAPIVEKLTSLPFNKVQHKVDTTEAQPSSAEGGILVQVTGALLVDEEQRPMSYVQTFQLVREGESYFVSNDIFKFVYPAS